MKRQLLYLLCGLSLTTGATAATLSPEQALRRLPAQGVQKAPSLTRGSATPVYTAKTVAGEPAAYVFDNSGNRGYLIVSADNCAAPLLGYADSGSFDAENMPEQMKWWLAEYGRQIEYARANSIPAYSPVAKADRKEVAPLLKTKWNQTNPYNLLTPEIDGVHCPTGCVATAVAQVMKYWEYPAQAKGTGTIVNPATNGKENMALGEEPFAWSDMIDSYSDGYTDAQSHAVAYLMKAVGYASEMHYGRYSSGAFSYLAGVALVNNFGYNPDIQYCTRNYFSATDWEEMIYNEVANGRPVLYGGQSTSVGHEFVCDGYNGEGYFHFNWGWSGMSDGYFVLDALNPNSLGTGGGEGGGYNYAQDALIGVQPERVMAVAPNLVQYGDLQAKASGLNVDFTVGATSGATYWFNTGLYDLNNLSLGVAIERLDAEQPVDYLTVVTANVPMPEYGVSDGGALSMRFAGIPGNVSVKLPFTLEDGKYKLTIVTKPDGSQVWTPVLVLPQYYNYVTLEKSGNQVTITNLPNAAITLDSAELVSALYYGWVARMKVVATNNTEKELTQGFYPELFLEGEEVMIGDGIVLTIEPNTTVTQEFVTTFRLLAGGSAPTTRQQYQLGWYDPVNGVMYDNVQDVVMNIVTNSPNLTVNSFGVLDVTPELAQINGLGEVDLYSVKGSDEVEFALDITNNRGFFGYPLSVMIFEPVGESNNLATGLFDPLLILEAKESASTTAKMNLSMLKKDHPYVAIVFYESANSMVYLPSCPQIYFELSSDTGVDEIGVEEDAPVKYYNLQGVEVVNPAKGQLLIMKRGSKASKIIF